MYRVNDESEVTRTLKMSHKSTTLEYRILVLSIVSFSNF